MTGLSRPAPRAFMLLPNRAPVAPRVLSSFSGTPILLEDDVLDCLSEQPYARIGVYGGLGSGKSMALSHLAAVLGGRGDVCYFDDPGPEQWRAVDEATNGAIVYSTDFPHHVPAHLRSRFHFCRLAPWGEDDLIEYLLDAHRSQCGSVIRRLHAAGDVDLLAGVPELCREVLDELASDEELPGVRAAVESIASRRAPSMRGLYRARVLCRDHLVTRHMPEDRFYAAIAEAGWSDRAARLLRHAPIQVVLSAVAFLRRLELGKPDKSRVVPPRVLMREAARVVAGDPEIRRRLEAAFVDAPYSTMPWIATILFRADPDWRPAVGSGYFLSKSEFDGARWAGVQLLQAMLQGSSLKRADLSRANLAAAVLSEASLVDANLTHATLLVVIAQSTDLSGADLSHARAGGANFEFANAVGMRACAANLRDTNWKAADLSDADFTDADLRGAEFDEAALRRAVFANARLDQAAMSKVVLREGVFLGASFRGTLLQMADLEFMVLQEPDFQGANLNGARLTGSVFPGANLRGASLQNAELAEVSWENADLRDADLRGASFHAGTTRDGIRIGGKPARWEHPPIYPDDESAQDYLPPEAMRKANLCGADLRGANLVYVDFYLVDLRGAVYDDDQAEFFRAAGAILENP